MCCMFRIWGRDLDVDRLLAALALPAEASFRKGEPLFPRTKPHGKRHKGSGVNFLVSDAEFDRFEKSKQDALAFLKAKKAIVRRIMNWPGVEGGVLDFGIEKRDSVIQCERLPAELLDLAGRLGLDIELSLYPSSGKNRRKKPTRSRTLRRVQRKK